MTSPLESAFQKPIYHALCKLPMLRVWRQNSGTIVVPAGEYAQRVVEGAPTGAADLSGLVAPEGWRLEIEIKVKAPWKDDQKRWKAFIEAFGGIYVLVRWAPALAMDANVARGVQLVLDAIAARRSR